MKQETIKRIALLIDYAVKKDMTVEEATFKIVDEIGDIKVPQINLKVLEGIVDIMHSVDKDKMPSREYERTKEATRQQLGYSRIDVI